MAEEPVTLDVAFLSGRTFQVKTGLLDNVKLLKKNVEAVCGIPSSFLRLISGDQVLNDDALVREIQGTVLNVHVLDKIPFIERVVPEGSLVSVDGIKAKFSFRKPQGWGSSTKIRFEFPWEAHPEFGTDFQAKDWMFQQPGKFEYRNCSRIHEVDWLLPESGICEAKESSPEQASCTWRVVASCVRVRAAADLESEELGYLDEGAELIVQSGCFLDDADRTPRLQVSSPLLGWVTPYLHTSQRVLILPPPTACAGVLEEIAGFLRKVDPNDRL